MKSKSTYCSYPETQAFSALVNDYINGCEILKPYYSHIPSVDGIKNNIEIRKKSQPNRELLVASMLYSYDKEKCSEKVKQNIQLLEDENTFTVCTAHQPNIFTGHLYFVYKIIHAIKLADELNKRIPEYKFVPVYYMGSEDADLKELGEVTIKNKTYRWETNQKGTVGRMKIDDGFIRLLSDISQELSSALYGKETIALLSTFYKKGLTIEQATFSLVNEIFGNYGLLIFLPDNKTYKKDFSDVMEKELFSSFSNKLLQQTIAKFPSKYKVQTSGRDINLFYLKDDIRERIEKTAQGYSVVNTSIHFTDEEIKKEIKNFPERFSPNVILRPLFQEKLLPNIAFIGGGGELAYWLELKKIFDEVSIPYPVLFLRNSFLIIAEKLQKELNAISISSLGLFKFDDALIEQLVIKLSTKQLHLHQEKNELVLFYKNISASATSVDKTLEKHVEALKVKALKRISMLEKKMFRAEKKKFSKEIEQLLHIKNELFPKNTLQERVDNLFTYYAVYGPDFIDQIYHSSLSTEQQFCVLEIEK